MLRIITLIEIGNQTVASGEDRARVGNGELIFNGFGVGDSER